MKAVSYIYLILISLCSFLHYPLAVIYPFGTEKSVNLVFTYEYPHIFTAACLSLCLIFLNINKIDFRDLLVKALVLAIALMLLSGLVFQVPFYRVIKLSAFFTVPFGVFLAVKTAGSKKPLIYMAALVFLLNLLFCLLIPGNDKIGFAANQNWLAATLLVSFPFFIITLKELPKKYFYAIAGVALVLTLIVFVRTSARALVPATGGFILYFLYQRKSLKVNAAVWVLIALSVTVVSVVKFDKIKRAINQDIRGPLSVDTCRLILSTPFLGTGPGNFQKDFPPFASDTLKKRIYYTSISEHPHNELLHLTATAGVPAGLLWLFLIYFLLKRRDDTEGILLQFSVLGTLIMGLADKPLSESPSAIIFLLACGLLIPERVLKQKVEVNRALQILTPVMVSALLLFGIYRTQIDIRSRYHYWKAEDLLSRMNSTNQKQIVPAMFAEYLRSSEIDPGFIKAAYNAACISLHFYDSLSQDERLLQNMIRLEPDYSDFNFRIGQYYMKQARILGEGEEKMLTEKEAGKYFLRNFELSPWNINRARSVVRFYVETGNNSKVEEWILKCREVTRGKLHSRYTHTDRTDLQGDLELWKNQLLEGREGVIDMTPGLKDNESGDYMPFSIFERTNALQSYATRPIARLDQQFWARRVKLMKFMGEKNIKSTKDILNFMASLKLKEEGMEWPLEVLESGDGNERSLISLACSLNSLLNKESAILVSKSGTLLCVLFDGEKASIWNCVSSVLIETKMEEFHRDKELRQQISGSEVDDFEYELFCYPEAFCLRNQVLADVVSLHPGIGFICESPSLHRVRLMKKNGDRKVRYANKHIGLLDRAALQAQ